MSGFVSYYCKKKGKIYGEVRIWTKFGQVMVKKNILNVVKSFHKPGLVIPIKVSHISHLNHTIL